MAKIGKFAFISLLMFFINPVQVLLAADIQTIVSEKQVLVGQVFTVSIILNLKNNVQPELSIHELPQNSKISFLRESKGLTFQTKIINGVAESYKTVTLNMIFHGVEKGVVNVPFIKLKINNKIFNAKGFNIEIFDKNSTDPKLSRKKQRSNDPFSNMESLFNDFFRNDSGGYGNLKGKDSTLDFFVDVEVSNMYPYFSEQFVAKWYLYTNGRVTDIDTLKYPALEGFWKDEISLATSLAAEEVQKNGKMFTRYLLASYALTPIVKDQAFIDPYEVKCQLIGGLFSFGAKEMVRKSDEAIIRIKPLPFIKPDDFTGAVGSFQATSYLKEQTFKIGQPFEYIIRVSGEGQLKFMELPELTLNEADFTIYDTSDESQFTPPLNSTKTYKILLVPQKEGSLTIPELNMSFFDPSNSKFYSVKTKPITINVDAGDKQKKDIVSAYDAKMKGLFKPLPYTSFSSASASFGSISGPQSFIISLLVFLASLGFLVYKYFSLQVKYDFNKDLGQRFEKLLKCIESNDWREASKLAVNIVYFFANAKAKNRPKSQKLEDILDVLPVGLRRSIELTMTSLNQDLQKYSFAPDALIQETQAKDNVLEKCLALKELLERSSEDASKTNH